MGCRRGRRITLSLPPARPASILRPVFWRLRTRHGGGETAMSGGRFGCFDLRTVKREEDISARTRTPRRRDRARPRYIAQPGWLAMPGPPRQDRFRAADVGRRELAAHRGGTSLFRNVPCLRQSYAHRCGGDALLPTTEGGSADCLEPGVNHRANICASALGRAWCRRGDQLGFAWRLAIPCLAHQMPCRPPPYTTSQPQSPEALFGTFAVSNLPATN